MKKLFCLLLLFAALCAPRCALGITPWFLKLVNATNVAGAQPFGAALLTPPTQPDTPFSINGTNLVFGGNSQSNFTFTLDGSGYVSNALYAGTYKFIFTNWNAAFVAVIPDTTNFLSLTLYITNVQTFSGVSASGLQVLTNLLGFIPANAANTNDFARATTAGITGSLGYTPGTNGYVGISALSGAASIATNGFLWVISYKTNNDPGPQFTNAPMGSLMMTTNGQLYSLSNLVWRLK